MSTKRKTPSWVYGLMLGSVFALLAFFGQLMNGVTGPDLVCHPLTNIAIYSLIFTGIVSLIRKVLSNGRFQSEQSYGHSELPGEKNPISENDKIVSAIYIDFYSQNSTSIKVNIYKEKSPLFFEVALFCFYTIRQLANLKGSGADKALADALLNAQDKDLLFFDLGDYIQASDVSVIVPKLISYAGRGNKSFISSLTITNYPDNPHFSMLLDTKGFGLLGSEINYYAIQSVNALIRYFANKYANNDDYRKVFAKAAYLCGQRVEDIGSPINQSRIAIDILKTFPLLDQAGSALSYFNGLTVHDFNNNYVDESVNETEASIAQSVEREDATSTQTQRDDPSSDSSYVVCWNCSTINRTSDKNCNICGVDLNEKKTKLESNLSFFGTFFKVALIFSIVVLILLLLGNNILNKNNSSNKALTLPSSNLKPPPILKPTDKPTLVPTKDPNILFSDDFSVRKSNAEFFDEDSDMWFGDDGSYYIKTKKRNSSRGLSILITASDVIIKTYAKQVDETDDGYFGVVCRDSDQGNYFFHVYENGFYEVGKYSNGSRKIFKSGKLSNSHNLGSTTAIVGECVGPNLSLRVNDKLLVYVSDDSLTTGNVGILSGAGDSGENTVKFLSVLVTKPINSSESKLPSPSNCIPWDKVTFKDEGKFLCITGNPIRVDDPHLTKSGDYFKGAVYFDAGWGKLMLEGFYSGHKIKVGECIKVQGYIYNSSSHPKINLNDIDTLISTCD